MDRARWKLVHFLIQLIVVAALLAPANAMAWKDSALVAWIIVGVFDLILLAVVGKFVYRIVQFAKYGSSRVLFERFPFFVGETMDLRWVTGRPLGAFRRINLTLRCVEEHETTVNTTKGKEKETCCYEVYTQSLPIEQAGVQESVTALPISFDLPNEPYGTQITAAVPRYWELEITADTPGVDYSATFLVPVYAHPKPEAGSTKSETKSELLEAMLEPSLNAHVTKLLFELADVASWLCLQPPLRKHPARDSFLC